MELENVSAALLLPTLQSGSLPIIAAQTGGQFDLGDRVVAVKELGGSPMGTRGTIVGVLGDDACEVLFDVELPSGTDLHGRCDASAAAEVTGYCHEKLRSIVGRRRQHRHVNALVRSESGSWAAECLRAALVVPSPG